MLSVVMPVYNEQDNLELLLARLNEVADSYEDEFEYIFVDDCSSDDTAHILERLCKREPRARAIRFSRNCGSHAAITAGLRHCRGERAVVMAADLQDPPELIHRLLDVQQEQNVKVVWASRAKREGEPLNVRFFSRIYWWVMNRFTDLQFAPKGTDVVLLNRDVIEAFLSSPEKHGSIFMLIAWLGFPQYSIDYIKEARHAGESGWTLSKKVKLFLDSLFSFSNIPIRTMTLLGSTTAAAGMVLAVDAVIEGLQGNSVPGWASLTLIVLVIGGLQMLMLGILGEYIWRTFDESRKRPFYVIESWRNFEGDELKAMRRRTDRDQHQPGQRP